MNASRPTAPLQRRRSAGSAGGLGRAAGVVAGRPGSGRPRRLVVACSAKRQQANPLTLGLVAALTEALRVFGVGKDRYEEVAAAPSRNGAVRRGDVATVMRRIRKDFDRAYFVTGVIDDSIYAPDTYFADPTIAFTGLALWKRNLQLLVPFLLQPRVELTALRRLGKGPDGAERLQAEWSLSTWLALPWKPLISILGGTEYVLNAEGTQVVQHIESWNVSGTEALLQMFRATAGPQQAQQ